MSDIEIRDDRQAGRLEAFGSGGGEVVGHIQYFVLESPGRALVPVHTIVEPAHEGQGIAGSLARELYGIAAREDMAVAPSARTSSSGPNATRTRPPPPPRNSSTRRSGGWRPTPRASDPDGTHPRRALRTPPGERQATGHRALPSPLGGAPGPGGCGAPRRHAEPVGRRVQPGARRNAKPPPPMRRHRGVMACSWDAAFSPAPHTAPPSPLPVLGPRRPAPRPARPAPPPGPRSSRGWVTGGEPRGYAGSSPEPTSTDWLEDLMTNPYPDPVPPGPTPGPGPGPVPTPGPPPEPPNPTPTPDPSPIPPGPEPVPNPEPGPPLS